MSYARTDTRKLVYELEGRDFSSPDVTLHIVEAPNYCTLDLIDAPYLSNGYYRLINFNVTVCCISFEFV